MNNIKLLKTNISYTVLHKQFCRRLLKVVRIKKKEQRSYQPLYNKIKTSKTNFSLLKTCRHSKIASPAD